MRAVNLIPAEHRSGGTVGSRSEGSVFIVLGLLAGIAVLALLYGLARHNVSSQRAEAASLTGQVQRVQAQAAQLAPYTSFIAMREQRIQAVSQLVGDRFDWAGVLHELGRVLPYDASLSAVQGAVGSAVGTAGTSTARAPSSAAGTGSTSVSSATPAGTTPTFTLTGCATSQSMVAQTLVRLRLIEGVSNVTLQSSTKTGGSSSGGGCPADDPAFNVVLTFDPLPTAPALSTEAPAATTQTVTSTAAHASKAAVSTTSGGRLR